MTRAGAGATTVRDGPTTDLNPATAISRDRDERGFFERASDEIASWFGDDDAERRRDRDDRMGRRERSFDRDRETWGGGDRSESYRPMTGDYGRSEGTFAASGYGRGDNYWRDRTWDRPETGPRRFPPDQLRRFIGARPAPRPALPGMAPAPDRRVSTATMTIIAANISRSSKATSAAGASAASRSGRCSEPSASIWMSSAMTRSMSAPSTASPATASS